MMDASESSKAGKALSDLGASKGGKARANVLTPEERKEIARRAAEARWGPKKADESPEQREQPLNEQAESQAVEEPSGTVERRERDDRIDVTNLPYSMFRGTLKMGDVDLECHVLNDHKRVLTQREVVRVLSGGRESGNLQRYLDRNPLTAKDFELGPTVRFLVPGTNLTSIGYEATLLIEICDKYLQARDMKLLQKSQLKLAAQAEIVMRACAKVGIIALIDEVTGYQKVRSQLALQLKLQAFIAEDMQEWARMFPAEFWVELARLEGINYSSRSRPLRWGKYVMAFVYDAIDPEIGNWLRENNPSPRFKKNHHQWLKQFGRERVHDQITKVVTIMKLCRNMVEFREKFAHVFKKTPLQMSFEDINWGQDQ